ncbi:HAMP domain-containing sensor histidine kinase [Kineococcus sp. NPDC059986]|uniref:sensor histidine kinase n=1 Tax=Kineococcus sp. NPDC059986 TaxID=3155538 RepID=UPI00344F55D9
MRRRLVLVLTLLSVLAVAAFAVPLAASTSAARTTQFLLVRTGDLDRLAATAAVAGDGGGSAGGGAATLAEDVARHHELYGEPVLVVDARGRVRASAGLGSDPLARADTAAAVDAALRNQPAAVPEALWPWSRDPVLLWRPVGTGADADGAVVLQADPALAAHDVARAWALTAAGAVLASLLAAGLALLLARWLLRPVQALADGVRDVMAGRDVRLLPETGPRELRALERSFLTMADTVAATAERQRHLVAEAAHQIRNPLAALQLRVDALDPHVGGSGRAGYEAALAEVDRLSEILDGTLGLAAAEASAVASAGPAPAGSCDPLEVCADRVAAWELPARHTGRALTGPAGDAAAAVWVPWPAGELAQVLDVLLDNALRHAGTGVQVSLSETDGVVEVLVDDDGPGIPVEDRPAALQRFWSGRGGTGLGLAIADRLVRGHGGELTLDTSRAGGLRVRVVLPSGSGGAE